MQGQGTLPSRRAIGLSSSGHASFLPPLPQFPSLGLWDVLPEDIPTSLSLPQSGPHNFPTALLPRGPISLLTLALMGPARLPSKMMAPPRAHSKCQSKPPRNWMAPPRLGVWVLSAKGAVGAFPPLSKGGWGGAAAQSCSCQPRAGGLCWVEMRTGG